MGTKVLVLNNRGFSLLEILVTLLIFSFIILSIYSLFDHSQSIYLHSDRRANAQHNARLIMEDLERDLRLIGCGVPKGNVVGGTTTWLPAVFNASASQLYFRGEVDNANTILTRDASTGNTKVYVENNQIYINGRPIVIVRNGRRWQGLVFGSADSDTNGDFFYLSAGSLTANFPANVSEIYSIEQIYYRFTANSNYPFGRIERAEVLVNTPNTTVPPDSEFSLMATNIQSLQFNYFTLDGTELTPPLDNTELRNIGRIVVVLTARERSSVVGQYQDVTLTSEILIRNKKL